MTTNLLSVIEQQNKALILMLNYPEARSYLGRDVCSVADAAIAAGKQALEQPQVESKPVALQWVAEMIMSDCGCSTNNERLLERVIGRIEQYERSNAPAHPQATEPAPIGFNGLTQAETEATMSVRGLSEPAPSAEVERWEPVEEMREQMDDMARIISTNAFYQEGHKDGLEWAAQCVEYNDPRTGDWMWDDRNDLANAIRKGPEMPAIHPALPAAAMPVGELTDEQISEIWESHVIPVFGRNGINPIVFARKLLAAASTQPVREPLADEELDLICEKALFCRISFQQFARSIEAAHGIK